MQKQLTHKRFTMRNELPSFSGYHWCAQVNYDFEPIANQTDRNYKRPDRIP
jgi:hypothetical protein